MKSTKDIDKTLAKNKERKPQRKRQRLEEQWKNKTSELKKKKHCKLAGEEANYSTGLDGTGLDWRVTHIRLERWSVVQC